MRRSTPRTRRGTPSAVLVATAALLPLLGCSDGAGVEIDPAVEPLVGTWEGTAVVLTNQADTTVSLDLIEEGGTFSLVVQPSGRYTAILTIFGQPGTETGQLSVSGNVVTLDPEIPADAPTTSGIFELQGEDVLIVDGETEFDFNLDGTDEPADVHMEFARQEG